MRTVNVEYLEEKIKNSGLKLIFIAEKIGVTPKTLDNKIKGRTKFRASEVYMLKDLLGLTDDDLHNIFFTEEVEI